MKIKHNENGELLIQVKKGEHYYALLHRINKGKYEQYIKRHDEIYVLNENELKIVLKYIQDTEVIRNE